MSKSISVQVLTKYTQPPEIIKKDISNNNKNSLFNCLIRDYSKQKYFKIFTMNLTGAGPIIYSADAHTQSNTTTERKRYLVLFFSAQFLPLFPL